MRQSSGLLLPECLLVVLINPNQMHHPHFLKNLLFTTIALLSAACPCRVAAYEPSADVKKNQQEFAADRFGIFIHWGIYSLFGQGEWYLNYGPTAEEYAKAAAAFYPADFNARQWADAIKDSGARYICFTTRHHDGFSMWHTTQSPYNVVLATPFGRDVLAELAEACAERNLHLHLYYSHLDWTRPDYPLGRTGHTTGRDTSHPDWESYSSFMDSQLYELLTEYGPIRAIWFDGWWDHDSDSIPFDWQLDRQYELVHRLQPGCLVANNHHQNPFPGEDIQIFERDVPGENTAGYSEQDISRLPLETCQTMNGMWGYKVVDTNYKSTTDLIRLLVKTSGMGANLLLNIGPQPNGELPAVALRRLSEIGTWLRANGTTIYSTEGSPWAPQPWGTFTRKGSTLFAHVISPDSTLSSITLPADFSHTQAYDFASQSPLKISGKSGARTVAFKRPADSPDYIIEFRP